MKLWMGCLFSVLVMTMGSAWAEVNINTASASELAQELDNVGSAKAAAIVEYRKMYGDFKSVDDLVQVHGIGETTLEMNRGRIILSDPHAELPAAVSKSGKQ